VDQSGGSDEFSRRKAHDLSVREDRPLLSEPWKHGLQPRLSPVVDGNLKVAACAPHDAGRV
jgi:hypothetical protein